MNIIIHKNVADLTVSAHIIKSLLGIKFTRAGQRHASAMGFNSANHLIAAVKINPIEREFEQYITILKTEILANHQISMNDELIERLRVELIQ